MKKNEKQAMKTIDLNNKDVYVECIEKSRKGELSIPESSQIRLFFVQKGSCAFFCAKHFDVLLETGSVVLVPPQNKCIISVKNNIQLIIVSLTVDLNFCNDLPFESLMEIDVKKKHSNKNDDIVSLKTNKIISNYLKLLRQCMSNNVKGDEFFKIKQKELLYYFGEFYTKEELSEFFSPILTSDMAFSKMVYQICERIHSVTGIAKEMNYSLSGFKKRFSRVFKMSAYKWLCEAKGQRLFHEITCSRKTFTQLSYDFGFSSPAHMNNFCRKMFGDTPGGLRAKQIAQ
ncbi:MAG: helix-turn-helix domain-containing protein [Prevotellaceae bacterium]|jgi:AraC-like DNA-binding protein|nr:helix-turn-helix domain-containing protein [Prevotellaceae bacterium]